jgi:UDP-glucose 4-epimerase
MNILVTGGCGFIGSNLVDELVRNPDNKVVVVDNLDTGKKENCNEKAHYIFEDIRDVFDENKEKYKKHLESTDIIFHLAALARIQPSFERPQETMDINTRGTSLICEFARINNAKVVYAGSSSFYGGVYLNPYSFTKWQGEEICKMYSEVYGVTTAIARFFNVYGKRHLKTGPYATVIGIFEHQISNNQALTITGTGEQRRDFTHVDDIVSGLIFMSRGSWAGEVFNLGTGKNHSINELAEMYKTETAYVPARPGEAWTTLADIQKSADDIGYNPKVRLEAYVSSWLNEEYE